MTATDAEGTVVSGSSVVSGGSSSVEVEAIQVWMQWLFQLQSVHENEEHGGLSNVELAILSNVCRSWRQAARACILEQVGQSINLVPQREKEQQSQSQPQQRRLLLLPSMLRCRIQQSQSQQQQQQQPEQETIETFCASWFTPAGIQELSNNNNNNNSEPTLCFEWRGYTTPMDVLQHFGYATHFVKDLWNQVTVVHHVVDPTLPQSLQMSIAPQKQQPDDYYAGFFAVRGAHIARPESYCLCVDAAEYIDAKRRRRRRRRHQDTVNRAWADIRSDEQHQSLLRHEQRRREWQRQVLPRVLHRQWIRSSSIEAAASSPSTFQPQQRRCVQFLNATGRNAVCMMTPPFATLPLPEPITVLCVAIATEDGCFVSGLHRRFELGHLYPHNALTKLTERSAICIATDTATTTTTPTTTATTMTTVDNGLDEQAEEDQDDDDDDYHSNNSSSSDDDDDDEPRDRVYDDDDDDLPLLRRRCECIFRGATEKLALPLDSDSNSENSNSNYEHHHGRRICRGRIGPGAWHCYTAIFDGSRSTLRVDGVPEPVTLSPGTDGTSTLNGGSTTPSVRLDGLTLGSDHGFGMSLCCGSVAAAQDDNYGTSCSTTEGQGALAEIAVFAGRIDDTDLRVLERDMMRRHGICYFNNRSGDNGGSSSSNNDKWKNDEWTRRAEALHVSSPECSLACPATTLPQGADDNGMKTDQHFESVPLRFMAQHHTVAWKQMNPVTGEAVPVKRIGCKAGDSSSDF